jgi:putative glutamine amidotransferase
MMRSPVVLVSPDVEPRGIEMQDASLSLSNRYAEALLDAGGLPLIVPPVTDPARIAAYVRQSDGVMLTGGEDVNPALYGVSPPPDVAKTVTITPDGGRRDLMELLLVEQAFRQRKPIFAICRGHQVLNVALGGTLICDLPLEKPSKINHRRTDKRCEPVHELRLTEDSLLARITGKLALEVNSTHHQAIGRVAPPLRVTARSLDGIAEALELKPGAVSWFPFLLSVQFHPERLVDRYSEHAAVFRGFVQACALNSKNL